MAAESKDVPVKCIVVGTDFSNAAEQAVRAGADLAGAFRAKLIIVHAVDPMIATLETAPQAILDDVRKGLADAKTKAKGDSGVEIETQLRIGKTWWALNETAEEVHADIVVVASRGRSALARAALGSSADRVLRTCNVPVLLIPVESENESTNALKPFGSSALAAIDFSDSSIAAATLAANILAACSKEDARLTLFHTIAMTFDFAAGGSRLPDDSHWKQLESEASDRLKELASTLERTGLSIETMTHRGSAPDGILERVAQSNVGFIAMGTHGRGAISRALLGSVAERVVHQARCPVLAVRKA